MRLSMHKRGALARPKKKPQIVAITAVSMAILVTAACGSSGGKASTTNGKPMQKVSLQVYSGGGLQSWPIIVAEKEGFFAKSGINAHVVTVNTGPQALAALTSGQLDMVQIDTIQAAPLLAKGKKLGIVMGNNLLDFSLVGGPKLDLPSSQFPASAAALKGKTIGVLALGGVLQDLAILGLQEAGVPQNSTHYTAISTGGLPADVAALKSGQVDAVMTTSNDNLVYEQFGGKVLLDFSKKTPDTTNHPAVRDLQGITDGGIWATQSWMSGHAVALKGTQLALMEADVWMHDPKNLAALTDIVKGIDGIPDAVPAGQVNQFITDSLALTHAAFPPAGATAEMNFAVKFGLVDTATPTSQYLGGGVPTSEADVQRAVSVAGGA